MFHVEHPVLHHIARFRLLPRKPPLQPCNPANRANKQSDPPLACAHMAHTDSNKPIEIIARGLILHGSKVLLCQNRKHEYYYLPGGHVEFGEPASLSLARELQEEAGLESTVGALLLLTEHSFKTAKGKPHHELNMVFHVEHLEWPEARAAPLPDQSDATSDSAATPPPVISLEEQIAFAWVELAALPDLDVRPAQLKAWLAAGGHTEPQPGADPIGWLTDCDPELLPAAE